MTAASAIGIINRRIASIVKLFGAASPEYDVYMIDLFKYETYENKSGIIQLSNNAANREFYRQLIPIAKKTQKIAIQVLERKAKEQAKDKGISDDPESPFANLAAYQAWYKQFSTHFESCYEIAGLENLTGRDKWSRTQVLYNDGSAYVDAWNALYDKGKFGEYVEQAAETAAEQENTVNENTGEVKANPEFYQTWSDIDYE